MKSKMVFIFFLISTVTFAQDKTKEKDVFDIARSGTIEEIKALTKNKLGIIDSINATGFSPLILACYRENNDVAEYLASKVKDINYNSSSGTALAAAAVKENVFLVKILLENKANPNIADGSGLTPLIYAIQFKNKEIVELLLKYKANKTVPDASGKTPFEHAVNTKDQEIINLIKN